MVMSKKEAKARLANAFIETLKDFNFDNTQDSCGILYAIIMALKELYGLKDLDSILFETIQATEDESKFTS